MEGMDDCVTILGPKRLMDYCLCTSKLKCSENIVRDVKYTV